MKINNQPKITQLISIAKINSLRQKNRIYSAPNQPNCQLKIKSKQLQTNESITEEFQKSIETTKKDEQNNIENIASSQSTLASSRYKNQLDNQLILRIIEENKKMKQKLIESQRMISFLLSQQQAGSKQKSPLFNQKIKLKNQNQFQNKKPQTAFSREYNFQKLTILKSNQQDPRPEIQVNQQQNQNGKLWEKIIPKKEIFLPKTKKTLILPEIKLPRENLNSAIQFETPKINRQNLKLSPLKTDSSLVLSKFEVTFSPNQDSVKEKNFFISERQEKKDQFQEYFGINNKQSGIVKQGYLQRKNKFPKDFFSIKSTQFNNKSKN